ncbi:MAG: hypothetical protein KAJ19_28960 [Gammaproteobacteria bacterium]|nr:hypothetical protein [Gammaproteobacteria bacterium]
MAKLNHRKVWYDHVQKTRRGRQYRMDGSDIGCRAALYAAVSPYVVDGKVALNVDQMDCDCARWTEGRVIDAVSLLAVEREVNRIYTDAEGPIYGLWFSEPERKAEYVSRDLAMEAFEDGHAHSVSTVRYDEDGEY